MSIMTEKMVGQLDRVEGKSKEVLGNLIGNPEMEVKGHIQKDLGIAQIAVADIKAALEKR
jgi:uncharacterized protein YjbJ (UPF0337 family)